MELNKRFEYERLKRFQILNGAHLKYIAFLSMFIDHFNNAIITPSLDNDGILPVISSIFLILGRIAFPIFIFFIVEGFFKTTSRKKYFINLFFFGIISEVPFDMFTSKVYFNPHWNNMMFTLILCLASIWIIDVLKSKIQNKILWYVLSILIVIAFSFVSMFLSLDYDYHAIVLAYIFYIFYDRPITSSIIGYLSIIKEVYSFTGFAFLITYNGKRGKQYKLFNYLFYPCHMLLLGVMRFYFDF